MFASADRVDALWTRLATSLVSGALAETAARAAKVATARPGAGENGQHVLCVYLPDVYDLDAVRDVMRVLLRDVGARLSGVKPDLYTAVGSYQVSAYASLTLVAGLDSKHPSGVSSTVWKNTAVLPEAEIKAGRVVSPCAH